MDQPNTPGRPLSRRSPLARPASGASRAAAYAAVGVLSCCLAATGRAQTPSSDTAARPQVRASLRDALRTRVELSVPTARITFTFAPVIDWLYQMGNAVPLRGGYDRRAYAIAPGQDLVVIAAADRTKNLDTLSMRVNGNGRCNVSYQGTGYYYLGSFSIPTDGLNHTYVSGQPTGPYDLFRGTVSVVWSPEMLQRIRSGGIPCSIYVDDAHRRVPGTWDGYKMFVIVRAVNKAHAIKEESLSFRWDCGSPGVPRCEPQ